mgnify:FL=1
MNIINSVIHTKRSQELVGQIIPILVGWAKYGLTNKTYGDLIHALGYTRYSGIGDQLGNVETVMRELRKMTGEDVPTLNALVKKNGIPSDGFVFVSPNYNGLTLSEKLVFVAGINEKALNYQKWDWVLDQLGLQPSKIITEQELEAISVHGDGGEGKEHKAIKEFVYNNSESLGINGVIRKETEYPLPSGDRIDVYFETSDCRYAIEVKPSTSPDDDITRGIFQCVKYKAVMEAIRKIGYDKYAVKTLLVTASGLSERNKKLAEALNVPYTENYKI